MTTIRRNSLATLAALLLAPAALMAQQQTTAQAPAPGAHDHAYRDHTPRVHDRSPRPHTTSGPATRA